MVGFTGLLLLALLGSCAPTKTRITVSITGVPPNTQLLGARASADAVTWTPIHFARDGGGFAPDDHFVFEVASGAKNWGSRLSAYA